MILSSAAIWAGGRMLARRDERQGAIRLLLLAAIPLMVGGITLEIQGQLAAGVVPSASGYSAVVFALASWQGFFGAVLTLMALYTVARSMTGRLNAVRRSTYDNMQLFWHYTVAQGVIALLVVHGFPRLLG
jgi:cytochrome c oxidase subunit I+III